MSVNDPSDDKVNMLAALQVVMSAQPLPDGSWVQDDAWSASKMDKDGKTGTA